ncbi:MAG: polyprenyl diphosphate synthase [Oscillospiraceae bacterium]|nr:polyprenyl diphosphate synthase [Oscillospiraceae bacterium]
MKNETENLPNHIGIIMDGNRRWAKKRMLPAMAGHKKGAEVLKERIYDIAELKIPNVTFYALSTENLNRSPEEVENLMRLLEDRMDELERISDDANVRLMFIGNLSVFPVSLQEKMTKVTKKSASNTGTICRMALNYGAKAEIVRAAKALAESSGEFSMTTFENHLYTGDAPSVDLIIRTGGEKRLSNFLLWQSAYAELYFIDILWCDFSRKELDTALGDYAKRNRRHGK